MAEKQARFERVAGFFSKKLFGFKYPGVREKNWSDLIIKAGAGFCIGTLTSFLLMKGKVYPAVIGTSVGCGIALGNVYNDDLNDAEEPKTSDKMQDEEKTQS